MNSEPLQGSGLSERRMSSHEQSMGKQEQNMSKQEQSMSSELPGMVESEQELSGSIGFQGRSEASDLPGMHDSGELPELTKERLQSMSDEELVIASIGPLLVRLRAKPAEEKAAAYQSLPPHRQQLFMLRVLDGHARGSAWEYYAWSGQLLQSPEQWSAVLAALRSIGGLELLQTVADTAAVHRKRAESGAEWRSAPADARLSSLSLAEQPSPPLVDAKASDLEQDPSLAGEIEVLFSLYVEQIPEVYRLAAERIRSAPEMYVSLNGS